MTARLHATAVLLGERAVLIRGPSGSGKSSLAWRLLATPLHVPGAAGPLLARLVSDDQTLVEAVGGRLVVRPHPQLAGLLEVRGHGILCLDHEPAAVVGMVVDRVEGARLPDRDDLHALIEGVRTPTITIRPHDPDPVSRLLAQLGTTGRAT